MKDDKTLRRDVLAELEYDPSIDARKIASPWRTASPP